MRNALYCFAIVVSGCSAQQTRDYSDEQAGIADFTTHCQFSLSDCYVQARKICGDGNFKEVDRGGIETIVQTTVGTETQPRHERTDIGLMNRSITFRCN